MNTSYPNTTRATTVKPDAVPKVQVKNSVSVDEEFDWESEKEKMDDFFEQQAANKLKDLPVLSSKPTQFKESTKLLPFQNEAIRWLVDMERNPKENLNSVCILQKNGQKRYFDVNRSTNESPFPLEGPYPKAKGCILADGTYRFLPSSYLCL
jgi:hypothetical protein